MARVSDATRLRIRNLSPIPRPFPARLLPAGIPDTSPLRGDQPIAVPCYLSMSLAYSFATCRGPGNSNA